MDSTSTPYRRSVRVRRAPRPWFTLFGLALWFLSAAAAAFLEVFTGGGFLRWFVLMVSPSALLLLCFGVDASIMYVARRFFGVGRGADGLTDTAHFATRTELAEKGFFEPRGLIVGGYCSKRGSVEPVRYGCDGGKDGGIVVFIRAGGGKSSAIVKGNLLLSLVDPRAAAWNEDRLRAEMWGREPSVVVVDADGSAFHATSRFQRETLGKKVLLFELLGSGKHARYNPAWDIRLGTPHEFGDARDLARGIVGTELRMAGSTGVGQLNQYWEGQAVKIAAASLLHLGYVSLHQGTPRDFSLPGLFRLLSSFTNPLHLAYWLGSTNPDVIASATAAGLPRPIPEDPHGVFGFPGGRHPSVVDVGNNLNAKAFNELSGCFNSLVSHLETYGDPLLAANIETSTFSLSDLANGETPVALYLSLPEHRMDELAAYVRTFLSSLLRELTSPKEGRVTAAGRAVRGNKFATILFVDEAASFGRLATLSQKAGVLRRNGVVPVLLFQNVAQFEEAYGKDSSLRPNMGVEIHGAPQTFQEAEALSDAIGKTDILLLTESGKVDGGLGEAHEQTHSQPRAILSPAELRALPEDEQIVLGAGLTARAAKYPAHLFEPLRSRFALPVDESDELRSEPLFQSSVRVAIGDAAYEVVTSPPSPSTPVVVPSKVVPLKHATVAVEDDGGLKGLSHE